MESEFPKNMHIYIQCILSWIPTKFGEISCSVLRRVVVLKYWDWQTSGLIDWLTDGRIKNMYTPRNFLHGLRKADEWYTMVVLNKVIALGWSQETTDRQTFYKETGFWSHRSNLSALSPKFWLNASKWKTSDNFYEALRQTSCRFGHYFAKRKTA